MYRTILVPLDGSPLSERAIPIASALGQAMGAQLVLLRAAGKPGLAGLDIGERQLSSLEEASEYLTPLATQLRGEGLWVDTVVPFEPAADAILTEIDIQHADLVVMSTHGRSGLFHLIYGSVAEAVVARSSAPVLLVRAAWETSPLVFPAAPRILVPLDGSAFAEAALPHAMGLAQALHGPVTLLHVVSPAPADGPTFTFPTFQWEMGSTQEVDYETAYEYLGRVARRLRGEGVAADSVVIAGSTNEEILAYSRYPGADLIVMATHGRTGLRGIVSGSVAFDILHRGRLPVLLVRPEAMAEHKDYDETVIVR